VPAVQTPGRPMTHEPEQSERVRVALLGCGRIARLFHLPALLAHPRVELVAVAEPDASAAEAARGALQGHDTRVVSDWTALVDDPAGLDAVVIALPTPLHVPVATAAFQAGLAAYVEKPLAADTAGAEQVVEAGRASGRTGMTGFNRRFASPYRQLQSALQEQQAGRVVAVTASLCSAPRAVPAWKSARATGGGALLDLAVHQIDLVRWLIGEVASVSAELRSVGAQDDTVLLQLRTTEGVPVQLLASANARQSDRFEVVGDLATLLVDRYTLPGVAAAPSTAGSSQAARAGQGLAALRAVPGALRTVAAPAPDESFAAALGAFVEAVAAGQPRPSQGAGFVDGAAAIRVVEAAERSALDGRRVTVERPQADERSTVEHSAREHSADERGTAES